MAGWLRRARGSLLSEPIDSLLSAVERDQYERALAETAAAVGPGSQQRTPGQRRSSGGGGAGGAAGGRASLWVQKYTPRAYIDLLSDEQINRWGGDCGGRLVNLAACRRASAHKPHGSWCRRSGVTLRCRAGWEQLLAVLPPGAGCPCLTPCLDLCPALSAPPPAGRWCAGSRAGTPPCLAPPPPTSWPVRRAAWAPASTSASRARGTAAAAPLAPPTRWGGQTTRSF